MIAAVAGYYSSEESLFFLPAEIFLRKELVYWYTGAEVIDP